MARRKHDFYPTPGWATEALFEYCLQFFTASAAIEPCAGEGAISEVLRTHFVDLATSDIDPLRKVDNICDASTLKVNPYTAVITNPPFNQAIEIVRNFVEQRVMCAFLLRLSFLEPTEARGNWLAKNPPAGLIILPRISFTGDGKTDSVTCAWMVWNVENFGVYVHPKTTNS